MTAFCGDDCSFHTADTAADDGDVLNLGSRLQLILVRLHYARIQSTSCNVAGIVNGLLVCSTLVFCHVETCVVAADTWTDIFQAVFNQLGDPFGVSQELTCHTHTVDEAFFDGLCTHIRFHSAGTYYRNIYKLLNMSYVIQVAVQRHIHRRMCPVPGVVGTVVRIEHVIACILQVLGRLFTFFHVTADFSIFFARHRTYAEVLHLGQNGVTQGYRIVLAAFFLDGLYDIGSKAVTIFEGTAVLVSTLVCIFQSKLVQQVAFMHRMNFHAIYACCLAEFCSLCKSIHDFFDFLHGHGTGCHLVRPAGRKFTRAGRLVRDIDNRLDNVTDYRCIMQHYQRSRNGPGTAHTCCNLNEQLGSGLMDFVHKFLQLIKHLLILPQPLAHIGGLDRCNTGNDQAYIIVSTFQEEFRCFLIKMVSCMFHPSEEGGSAHRTQYNSVLDFQVSDFPRGKQGLILIVHVCHTLALLTVSIP